MSNVTARQGKIEMPPISTTALTQQATGQTPGPQQAPALSGSSRGAVGAGEPSVPGVSRRGNQPPANGGNQPVGKERKGRLPLIILLVAVILLIVAIASAGYAYVTRAGQGAKGGVTQGPLTTSPSTRSSTATAPSSPTATVTPKPPPTGIPTSTPTHTTQPVPFSVTRVTVSANPSNFQGTCTNPMLFAFTATISVPAGASGGTATYHWLRSDSATAPPETITFNPGVTAQTVTTTWPLGAVWGNGSTNWVALQVTAPNSVTSTHANFSFVCQFTVTSINAWVSPTTYNCSRSVMTFLFSATITLSPGPNGGNITYTWARSDGATMVPKTLAVPAGQTTVTVTNTWTLGVGAQRGAYWERVVITGPNSITSNKATLTKSC